MILTKLVKCENTKYDNFINLFLPIKRGKLVYKYFNIII